MGPFPRDVIPPEVLAACRSLQGAGFLAYLVGGAVRDLLLRPDAAGAKDFDLTTSALPEQVVALFRRTIPTGLQHGTVTVLCDPIGAEPGTPPRPVEITTFRGEVGFSDGRRPDRVEFISDLVEDLRRRDFTINAIAYDPFGGDGAGELVDPFGGREDLARRCIRAVGDANARFAEDGLRVLRAVRFAAQLEFTVEESTRAAFAGALPTLRKVSRERVRDELQKLLKARVPSRGLRLMFERSEEKPTADWGGEGSLLRTALPEVAAGLPDLAAAQRWCAIVDAAPKEQRLAAALWPMRRWLDGPGAAARHVPRAVHELLDERLKLPAPERDHLAQLLLAEPLDSSRYADATEPELRRLLASMPRRLLDDLVVLQRMNAGDAADGSRLERLGERLRAVLAQRPPLSTGELALGGKDLIRELELRPGPEVGALLRRLLDEVLEDPSLNERQHLIERARALR